MRCLDLQVRRVCAIGEGWMSCLAAAAAIKKDKRYFRTKRITEMPIQKNIYIFLP
jgi:hypothetical protein